MEGKNFHEAKFSATFQVKTFYSFPTKQRMILNGQHSSWVSITAQAPEVSCLGSLFFLIYINDLSKNLSSNPNLFADGTSFSSNVHNLNSPTNYLNEDLKKVNDWATRLKMSLNPNQAKEAQEVTFSRKIKKGIPHST